MCDPSVSLSSSRRPSRRLAPGAVDAGAAAGGIRSADLLERRQLPGVSRRSDFNGDDDPDLAVANRFSSDVSVLLGGAAGGFTGPTDFAAGSPYVVAVADFNADGKPDLTTTHPTTNNVAVLL